MAKNVEQHIIRLKDEMSAKLGNISKQLEKVNSKMKKTSESINKVQGGMKNANKNTKEATSTFKSFGNVMRTLALAAVAKKLYDVGAQAYRTSVEFENMQNKLDFSFGNKLLGENAFNHVVKMSKELGLNLTEATRGYTDLQAAAIGTAFSQGEVKTIFDSVSKAATVLHLDADKTSSVFLALEQMMSKGTVSMEELRRQLGNSLPGALSIAARSMGKTQQEFNKMVENGEVLAYDLLPKLAKELDNTFGSGLEVAANSSQAAINKFSTEVELLYKNLGDGLKPAINSVLTSMTELIEYFNSTDITSNISDWFSGFFKGKESVTGIDDIERGKRKGRSKTLEEVEKQFQNISKLHLDKDFAALKAVDFLDEKRSTALNKLDEKYKLEAEKVEKLKQYGAMIRSGNPSLKKEGQFGQQVTMAQLEKIREDIGKYSATYRTIDEIMGGDMFDKIYDNTNTARILADQQKDQSDPDKKTGKGKGLGSNVSSIRSTTPKNVTINIGSLIGNNNVDLVKDPNDKKAYKKMENVLTEALIRVVNDATTVNEK